MAESGKKIFSITINGIQESIDAVDKLNKQLGWLEQEIDKLSKKTVNVGVKSSTTTSSGGGSKSSSVGALTEEEKLAKQIEQIDAKREAYSKEIYQNYLAAKDVLKETVTDQKAIAASERLQADAYSNTMMGMKQKLADLKAAMQTVDLGDTDTFKKMTDEANELNKKLLEIEKSYGQFGRNVGNYPGVEKLKVTIAGVTQEFDSAKQAAKTLGNELKTLSTKKDLGMILSEDELKRLEELPDIVAQINSAIADAGKPMDALMDAMQSFVALAQVGKGFSAFFGLDNDAIDRSIQKLVALQNGMQGLQTIQKQLQSSEGLGGWIKSASSSMDAFAASITKTEGAAKKLSVTLKVISGLAILATIVAIAKALYDLNKAQNKVNEAAEEGLKAYAKTETELSALKIKLDDFNGSKKQEKKLVDELNSKYGSSIGQYKTLTEWKQALIKKGQGLCKVMLEEAKMQAILNLYTENYIKLQKARKAQEEGAQDTVDLILKALDGQANFKQVFASMWDDIKAPFSDNLNSYNDELQREIDELEKNDKELIDELEKSQKKIDSINKEYGLNDYAPTIEDNGKKTKKAVIDAENEVSKARISAMKDGLLKTITQLEEERKQRLNKLDKNARSYKQQEKLINDYYNNRILEATEDWSKKMEKIYSDMWININNYEVDAMQKNLDNWKKSNELSDKFGKQVNKNNVPTYGIQGTNRLSNSTQKLLGVEAIADKSKFSQDVKQYADLYREWQVLENTRISMSENLIQNFNKDLKDMSESEITAQQALEMQLDKIEVKCNAAKDAYDEFGEKIKEIYGEVEVEAAQLKLVEEGYSKDLSTLFNQRISEIELYYEEEYRIATSRTESAATKELEILEKSFETRKEENRNNFNALISQTNDWYDKEIDAIAAKEKIGTYTAEQAADERLRIEEEYKAKQKQLEDSYETTKQNLIDEYANKEKEIELNKNEEKQRINAEYYNNQLQELRDFQTAITNLEEQQPVKDRFGWGYTNWPETKKNYENIVNGFKTMAKKLTSMKLALNMLFKNGIIDKASFESTMREINAMLANLGEKIEETEDKMSGWSSIQVWFQDMQQYIQAVANSFNQVMSAIWDAEDTQFDKQQEALDKQNELLDEKLSEQQDIIEKHKDAINDIEDELASARGDRRQHLIDQLNAQIAAQRAAAKEEKKIEKQKEALQRKQDELDRKRKEAQYKRDMIQAVVNGAMAVTMAAVNHWPIPAIPMMALAASTTAAQIAIMAANKPYRKGGLLEGPSHENGGIPVGNTGIEVEGQEYVIRRESASPNVELLDYINNSKRRLNIDDFIEFYSSGKQKKIINSISPSRRFAEGGAIPSITTNYNISDRLLEAFEKYSDRAVVVSVQDINDRQAAVKQVQVLAGLSE